MPWLIDRAPIDPKPADIFGVFDSISLEIKLAADPIAPGIERYAPAGLSGRFLNADMIVHEPTFDMHDSQLLRRQLCARQGFLKLNRLAVVEFNLFIPPDIVGGRNVFETPVKKPPTGRQRIEALILAAEDRSPLMQARIGVLRSLNRRVERMFNSDRKDTHSGKRKLGRVAEVCVLATTIFCSFEGTTFL